MKSRKKRKRSYEETEKKDWDIFRAELFWNEGEKIRDDGILA